MHLPRLSEPVLYSQERIQMVGKLEVANIPAREVSLVSSERANMERGGFWPSKLKRYEKFKKISTPANKRR